MRPRFSIVIPTKDRPLMLQRAVDSILQQTFQDWELLVIDDNSTTPVIELASLVSDPRVRVYTNDHTKGPGACRKMGVDVSSGEYLFFLDDDDYYEVHHLAGIHDFITNQEGTDWLFAVQMAELRKDGSLAAPATFLCGGNPLMEYWNHPVSLLPFVIARTAALRWPSPIIPSPIEDFEWICTLLSHCSCTAIPAASVVYVQHDQNRTGNLTRRADLLAREAVVHRLGDQPDIIGTVGKQAFFRKLTHQQLHWSRQCLRKGQWRDAAWGLLRALKCGRLYSLREWAYTLVVALRMVFKTEK